MEPNNSIEDDVVGTLASDEVLDNSSGSRRRRRPRHQTERDNRADEGNHDIGSDQHLEPDSVTMATAEASETQVQETDRQTSSTTRGPRQSTSPQPERQRSRTPQEKRRQGRRERRGVNPRRIVSEVAPTNVGALAPPLSPGVEGEPGMAADQLALDPQQLTTRTQPPAQDMAMRQQEKRRQMRRNNRAIRGVRRMASDPSPRVVEQRRLVRSNSAENEPLGELNLEDRALPAHGEETAEPPANQEGSQHSDEDERSEGDQSLDTVGSLPPPPLNPQLDAAATSESAHDSSFHGSDSEDLAVAAANFAFSQGNAVNQPHSASETVPGAVYAMGRAFGDMPQWARNFPSPPTRRARFGLRHRVSSSSAHSNVSTSDHTGSGTRTSQVSHTSSSHGDDSRVSAMSNHGDPSNQRHGRRRHLRHGSSRLGGSVMNLFRRISGVNLPEAEPLESEKVVYAQVVVEPEGIEEEEWEWNWGLLLYSVVLLLFGIAVGRWSVGTPKQG